MECIICSAETGSDRKRTCSGKCRKILSRQSVTKDCDNISVTEIGRQEYVTLEGLVYNRLAVQYERDDFRSRPIPLDSLDQPLAKNRGRYTRPDGSQYQFDCRGQSFKVVNGRIYQTAQDVMECYKEAV